MQVGEDEVLGTRLFTIVKDLHFAPEKVRQAHLGWGDLQKEQLSLSWAPRYVRYCCCFFTSVLSFGPYYNPAKYLSLAPYFRSGCWDSHSQRLQNRRKWFLIIYTHQRFQSLMTIGTPGESCWTAFEGLTWSLRSCISNKLPLMPCCWSLGHAVA